MFLTNCFPTIHRHGNVFVTRSLAMGLSTWHILTSLCHSLERRELYSYI
jgi:hypothetical protein